jgi:hypothetical protein
VAWPPWVCAPGVWRERERKELERKGWLAGLLLGEERAKGEDMLLAASWRKGRRERGREVRGRIFIVVD